MRMCALESPFRGGATGLRAFWFVSGSTCGAVLWRTAIRTPFPKGGSFSKHLNSCHYCPKASSAKITAGSRMDKATVFTKTAKGITQVNQRSASLSKDLMKVLKLIDGKSNFGQLLEKAELDKGVLEKAL